MPITTNVDPPSATSALERLQSCLEEELDALEGARFRLEVQQAVLTTGRQRWLSEATTELENAVERLQRAEATLREALASAALSLGLSPEATLREVAGAAQEPWGFVFARNREEVVTAVESLSGLGQANRKLLVQGLVATSSALAALGAEQHPGYDATGALGPVTGSMGLLDARA